MTRCWNDADDRAALSPVALRRERTGGLLGAVTVPAGAAAVVAAAAAAGAATAALFMVAAPEEEVAGVAAPDSPTNVVDLLL